MKYKKMKPPSKYVHLSKIVTEPTGTVIGQKGCQGTESKELTMAPRGLRVTPILIAKSVKTI